MENKRNINEFLNVTNLQSFNDKVSQVVSINQTESQPEEVETMPDTLALNRDKFESTIVKPDAIPQDDLYQCADIIDGKTHLDNQDFRDTWQKGPNTIDRLLDSMGVAYITENDIPVACASITDPTEINYRGVIPIDYYELRSGFSLEGRLQQETFAVKPEYRKMGIATELRNLLQSISPQMFITVPVWNTATIAGLAKNGYRFVSEFQTDWDQMPIQLWIN